MEKIKVNYDQIEKANKEIEKTKIGSKGYAQVNERIKAFRKVYPTGTIETTIEELKEDYVRIRTVVKDENEKILATGTASETNTGNNKINLVSMVENCETSSVGRALGFTGFGVDTSVASAEDIENNKEKRQMFEIYTDMFIKEDEAKYIIKVVIVELARKMGVVKESLNSLLKEKIWATMEELNVSQLLKLETKLKTVNMEDNDWHILYNENLKIKDVVPKNQEVVYDSSWYKFGKLALEKAGTDELLRNDIIDSYLGMGINLGD